MSRRNLSPLWYLQALRRWLTGRSPVGEPHLIFNDRQTAVAWLPAAASHPVTRLLVVFQSARRKSFRPYRLDFRDVAWCGGENHVLVVTDRCASWYSQPGQRDFITALIRGFVARNGIEMVWAIGTSMGGYGAILFGEAIPASKVVAFVPQVLMTEAVISSPAWAKNRSNITDAVERDLVPILTSAKGSFFIVYGDQDKEDLIQFDHLRRTLGDAENVRIMVARGKNHRIAPWLSKEGLLGAVVAAIWAEDWQAMEACSHKLETPLELLPA